jgi:hypothetical protein
MKKLYFMMLLLSLLITSGCTMEYKGEYIRWGDTVETVDTERLKENNIPFKIKDNKVYIPEDAFDKGIMCCS